MRRTQASLSACLWPACGAAEARKAHSAEDARQAWPQAEQAIPAITIDAANMSRVRHARPLHGQLSQARQRPTVPCEAAESVKVANELVIDLPNDSD